jgi:LuxR family maltose regulon positive regulatory protein
LEGLAQGLTREEIARNLSISVNTVKSAVRSVYNKLGAVNRADAVRIAVSYFNER